MRKRKPRKIHFHFVLFVFFIMLLTFIIMASVGSIVIHLDLIPMEPKRLSILYFFIVMCVSSVIIGTILTIFAGKKQIAPIVKLSEATKEVANGNFTVQVEDNLFENSEIGDFINNFNKMVLELGNTEILRNDFIVNVSHEFKTPIAAIQGYAALLQDDSITNKEKHEYTQMILESASRLSVLLTNILKLSKLESQEIVVDKTNFSLDEQIRQALLLLEPEWSNKKLQLNISLPPKTYYGSEDLLMQVWLNLLGNAIKFSNEGGFISVSLSSYNNSVFVTIRDYGIGIKPETQKRIFEKFYQGDQARTFEGNGLGLALVKRIVDLCEGQIRLESEPQKGSAFTVILPL